MVFQACHHPFVLHMDYAFQTEAHVIIVLNLVTSGNLQVGVGIGGEGLGRVGGGRWRSGGTGRGRGRGVASPLALSTPRAVAPYRKTAPRARRPLAPLRASGVRVTPAGLSLITAALGLKLTPSAMILTGEAELGTGGRRSHAPPYSLAPSSSAVLVHTVLLCCQDAIDRSPRKRLEEDCVTFYTAEMTLALFHLHDMGLMYR